MIDKKRLISEAATLGADISEQAAKRLDDYCERLIETNKTLNLTAITDPREVEIKHLLDSSTLLTLEELRGKVADVGTGAGFPGVVLKAARPELSLTLIDATGKKLKFIENAAAETGIEVTTLHGRAEELARGEYRESFDTVTARAVASLPSLLEYCLPLVKAGGHLIAMKGPDAEEEIALSKHALKELSGMVIAKRRFTLPDESERVVVVIKKISQTAPKYPRSGKNISKSPL